ncbi:circadian clock KaiB family protein [Rhizobium populisoli]|uniref:circadian clock KaiB family protein n=1 Tax=Rhizobium populisoli TaxID=2859785 RepID=UPI0035E42952
MNGASLRAEIAAKNVQRASSEYAPGEFEIEVIDVRAQPQAVRDHNLVALPALLGNFPPPVRKIVGFLRPRSN